ncbi:MAG: DnaJ domain-containing protein [Clostridia bacterium]|nr:DnaJ domain-containing protein [Clostridia bacterium]MBQ4157328.1 DnaJ domain-containing protein [Clostridia bacterium]
MTDYHRILGVAKNATQDEIHHAYRELARRWHPDRFADGPERAWAEEKMVSINSAYNALVSHLHAAASSGADRFSEALLLIEAGQLSRARKVMCAMEERDAEWNYHFGVMLTKRGDYKKAVTYLSIAVHQESDNQTYHQALQEAKRLSIRSRFHLLKMLCSFKQKKRI